MKYDLETRTISFGKEIIKLCRSFKFNQITSKIIEQLVRAGTSIGANYMEAMNASSRKDFKNKLFICKKESQETRYWLIMLKECVPDDKTINILAEEARQLNLIFQKSIKTVNDNLKLGT